MNQPQLTVLVLAGGSLAGKTLGPAPPLWQHPLLLPAGSGLAVHQILRFYREGPLPVTIRLVVDEPPPEAVPLHGLEPDLLQAIAPQPHILGTLKAALATVTTPWVLINPITTLPSRPPELRCQIQVGDQALIREDWSALQQQPDGSWRFESKADPRSEQPSAPFTGIVVAPLAQLQALLAGVPAAKGFDLLHLAQLLLLHGGGAVLPTPWHDLGHRTTHASSRRSRLPSRSFNRLHHCRRRDVIVKQSVDAERLQAERAYLAALPGGLQRHFPALLRGEAGEEEALVMEAIPFPSLAELHLHWDLGPNAWLAILERLAAIQAEFRNAAAPLSGASAWLYGAKLQQRWQGFSASAQEHTWWQQHLRINGRHHAPLAEQIQILLAALEPLQAQSSLQLIHGDFCFNNILCDPLYTAIRLIDPRGEAAPLANLPRGYGDSRYDLVKLFHSIAGHYDAIVNNLFQLRWQTSNALELEIYTPPHQAFLARAFEAVLKPADLSLEELQLLTSSLFFSMLPLHQEDTERQLALAVSGMLMLESALA